MAHRITAPAMQRIQRLLTDRITPAIFAASIPFTVDVSEEMFESCGYAHVQTLPLSPFAIGTAWGRPWHTRWFRLSARVPAEMAGKPLRAHIDLGFRGRGDGFETEAMVWMNDAPVHAIQPDRRTIDLGTPSVGTEFVIWVEAAATPIIAGHVSGYGPSALGDPATAPQAPLYRLRDASIVVWNEDVQSLATELHALIDLTIDLSADTPQRPRLFAALEAANGAIDPNDIVSTAPAARAELARVLTVPNGPAAHRITATGHAHLDTAWLWPLRETRRKALRTFANAVDLLERNPDFVFCHSQAQHYAWVREDAPELFAKITRFVKEGRWEPVGGMWVETDLNLPDGESLLRQMTQGQRAFREWFGITCNGAFLPDDFGYPAALPQIVRHGGGEWFFTQKLSWNETNKMPHHTFWWEGLDGSRVFTHFSPVDTYNALNLPSQFRFAERNFADHVGASTSLVLYGHGDGGGGPTQQMIERARLCADLQGVPRVTMGRVSDFFAESVAEYGADAPVWVGEMYFEKHRGTYSTQVKTKQGNRRNEKLLREVETWAALNGSRPGQLDEWWQRLLTQQFHDIIPGSSIAWVHQDAEAEHTAITQEVSATINDVLGTGTGEPRILNHLPRPWSGVLDVHGDAVFAQLEPLSHVAVSDIAHNATSVATHEVVTLGDSVTVNAGTWSVTFDGDGTVSSLRFGDRDVIPDDDFAGFVMRTDTPAEYDNWDIDMADADRTADHLASTSRARIVETGALRTVLEFEYATDASTWTVRWTVLPDRLDVSLHADWQENERRLQWRLPTDVHARDAVCGTQFGHVRRARHDNTSWDHARFEVCAHRYVAVSEPGFGVALVADGPRGYDVRNDAVCLTILRSPRFPDPFADRGEQTIEWSVVSLSGDPAYENFEVRVEDILHPPRVISGTPSLRQENKVVLPAGEILISAIKPADDGSDDVIVRLWQSTGARSRSVLSAPGYSRAHWCDALEQPQTDPVSIGSDGSIALEMQPFEIGTLRLSRR